MSLSSLVAQGQYDSAQDAYDAITTASIEVLDEQLYTWAGVALLVGAQGAEALRLALDGNGMGWVVHQLGGSGIQLSNSLVQQALLGFAQAGVPGCSTLAAKGRTMRAAWQVDGLSEAPTLEAVTKLWIVDKTRRDMASVLSPIQSKSTAINAWLDALDVSSKTVQEVQDYCDSLIESQDGNPGGE